MQEKKSAKANKGIGNSPGNRDERASSIQAAVKMGLCVNCEARKTCVFPKARQNVQQCEEYQ